MLEQPPRSIALSAVVLYELRTGIAKSTFPRKRRRQLQTLLAAVAFLPFGREEADVAGELRAELERKGTPIGQYDILIAATALANRAKLVTRNTTEFSRVAGLELVDWY